MTQRTRSYNTKPNQTSFKPGHKKLGGFVTGSRHTEAAKERVRQSLLGKRGPLARNWQGGKTKLSTIIRYSSEMKAWRRQVFERDGYKCVNCGATGYLEADHIKPFAFFPDLRFELSNGRTLCRPCHKLTDTYASNVFKHAS